LIFKKLEAHSWASNFIENTDYIVQFIASYYSISHYSLYQELNTSSLRIHYRILHTNRSQQGIVTSSTNRIF